MTSSIPELRFPEFEGEWEKVPLSKKGKFTKGMGVSKNDLTNEGIPAIRYGELYTTYEESIGKVESKVASADGLKVSQGNEVLIPSSGETAIDIATASALQEAGVVLGGDINVFRTTESAHFIAASIRGIRKHDIAKLAQGISVSHIYGSDLKGVIFSFPSLPEQKKIAAFLSAVDEKIAALEAQLAGWRSFKRGMMQALFSRALRFKADDGSEFPDWLGVKIESSFSFHKTNSLSRNILNLEQDGIRNIHYGDIHTEYAAQFDIKEEVTGVIPSNLSDKAGDFLKEGDVIFADASEDYNDVGKAIEIINLDGQRVVAGLHTIVARPNPERFALGFAAYLFASWPLRKQLMRIANGASVLGISKTNLAKVELSLPSLPEQQKIANALSAIDAKIDALTDRLDATREFKRGLLQKMFV